MLLLATFSTSVTLIQAIFHAALAWVIQASPALVLPFLAPLQSVLDPAARAILQKCKSDCASPLLTSPRWTPFHSSKAKVLQWLTWPVPPSLSSDITSYESRPHSLHSTSKTSLLFKHSRKLPPWGFCIALPSAWNVLSPGIQLVNALTSLKFLLKCYLQSEYPATLFKITIYPHIPLPHS